jgi:class 3 adenylate cyclase
MHYAHDRGFGVGGDDLVTSAATLQLLKELAGIPSSSLETISEITSKLGFSLKTMDQYLNLPFSPAIFSTGTRGTFAHRRFWTHFMDKRTGPWVITAEAEAGSMLLGLPEKIQSYQGQNSSPSGRFEYLFLGQLIGTGGDAQHYYDFPLRNQNDPYLSMACALSRVQDGKIFQGAISEKGVKLMLGGNFSHVPAYALALSKNVSPHFLRLKNRLNTLYVALITVFLLLIAVSATVSSRVTLPLKRLEEGLKRIEKGDLSREVLVPGRDEFQHLTQRFNSLLHFLREKEEITGFLSQGTAEHIVSTRGESSREEACVIFAGLLEQEESTESVDETARNLQAFVSLVQDCVFEHGGRIDKFTGTACLGLFTAEKVQSQPLQVTADLLKRLRSFNTRFESLGKSPLRVGIGLATGAVVLGHVGSEQRKDFTCIGNTVNLAARLENLAMKSPSLVTAYVDERTQELNPASEEFSYQELDPVKIKGKRELQKVYELIV